VTTGLTPLFKPEFFVETGRPEAWPKSLYFGSRRRIPLGFADWQCLKLSMCEKLDGQAQITPAVDLSHLEDVFVVTGRK